jgi:GcrA cell cycle regulator
MRRLNLHWTPEDDERLKELAAQGASILRAAAALKRSQTVVRQRARKLGCPLPGRAETRKKSAAIQAGR